MTVNVNEVLAQQLTQPLINVHRHLVALELTVPGNVEVIFVRILSTISEKDLD